LGSPTGRTVSPAYLTPSAHIVGLSWGALLAQEFYRRYAALVLSLVLADTYAGWKGSLPEPIPEERLAACLRDASLPPAEFVPKYLPGMFSESPRPEVRDDLARIMSEFHPLGFRLDLRKRSGRAPTLSRRAALAPRPSNNSLHSPQYRCTGDGGSTT
jgi:pimeloyl-ACP methyl ester carboxylesterase